VPNPFALHAAEQDGVCVISLEGFLDAHTAPQFEHLVQTEVQNGQYRILVDCTSLTYISSAGLGVFMSFVEEIRDRSGDLKICGLVPKVRHTFEILGFQDIFDLLDDVPTGLKRFAGSGAAEGAN
jgi:anti-sigma B factor antagonist